MSSAVTRFEVILPITMNGSPDYNAIETFKTNLENLCPCFIYPVSDKNAITSWAMFGYVTAAQQATALGYLNTLNAALSTGPVPCVVWNGSSQP